MKVSSIKLAALLSMIVLLTACETLPKDAFKLSATTLEDRQTQSRRFDTRDEIALLSAGIGVLQDMGYTIDESEKDAGLITASKSADATSGGQVAAAVFVALLGGGSTPIDKEQKIKVSFVTVPSKMEKGSYQARITFQRVIWNTQNAISRAETIKDVEIYQEFFSKLSKSVFLEAHSI